MATQPPYEIKRTGDFSHRYANNVQLEASPWDLKLLFGQVDQSSTPVGIHQHTAVTVSWPEVKALIYFLRAQLAAHESQVGKIVLVPETVNAPIKEPPDSVTGLQRAVWDKAYSAMNKVYAEYLRDNPEADPDKFKAK